MPNLFPKLSARMAVKAKHANLIFAALLLGFTGVGLIAATLTLGETTLLIGATACLAIAGACIVTYDAKS